MKVAWLIAPAAMSPFRTTGGLQVCSAQKLCTVTSRVMVNGPGLEGADRGGSLPHAGARGLRCVCAWNAVVRVNSAKVVSSPRSLRLNVGCPDHLTPLGSFVGHQPRKVGWGAPKHRSVQVGKPSLNFRVR